MCHQCLKCSVAVGVALTKLVGAPTAMLLLEAEASTCGGRMSGLMKVKDAARFLALSESMVRKRLTSNELTAVRIGRSARVRLQDLEALVARGVRDSGG
jgi:excisionase family DNA binding protein